MKKYIILLSLPLAFLLTNTIQAQTSEPDPIVIIPGTMASWNWNVMTEPFPDVSLGGWEFTPGVKQYDRLIQAFEDAGMVRGQDFFITFYDWRQNNADSASNYLVPVIDEALAHSESGRVDILAHSMGGLVARAYIQSDDYRNDVDQLIMLGTPNQGSSDVYTLWEGALVPSNWDRTQQAILRGYLWYMTIATGLLSDPYEAIHVSVPSIQELLPTYNYLVEKDTGDSIFVNNMQEQNLFLKALNLDSGLTALADRVEHDEGGGVYSIAGEGESTVDEIPVIPHTEADGKLWTDGKPDPLTPVRNDTDGDNRVLSFSAFLPDLAPPLPTFNEVYDDQTLFGHIFAFLFPTVYAQFGGVDTRITLTSGHGALPTNAIENVFDILGLGNPVTTYTPPSEPDEVLSFWFASPVDVKVTSPGGQSITKDENSIPGALYDGEDNQLGVKIVLIENPESGEYTVELTGLADGHYHVGIGSFTENGSRVETVEKDITESEQVGYHVVYTPENAETPTETSNPFIPEEAGGGDENDNGEQDPAVLLDVLTASLQSYYDSEDIRSRGTYRSLLAHIHIAQFFLERDRRPLVTLLLQLFERQVDRRNGGRYESVNDIAAEDLTAQADKIIDLLRE